MPTTVCCWCAALQGCGIVEFESREAAQEAMRQLDGRYVWPPAHRPLLVTPVRTPQVSRERGLWGPPALHVQQGALHAARCCC